MPQAGSYAYMLHSHSQNSAYIFLYVYKQILLTFSRHTHHNFMKFEHDCELPVVS